MTDEEQELLRQRNKFEALALLNLQESGTNFLRAEVAEAKLTECEARLSKAMEALQWYADFGNYLSNRGGYAPIDLDKGGKAEDTLAELEVKE